MPMYLLAVTTTQRGLRRAPATWMGHANQKTPRSARLAVVETSPPPRNGPSRQHAGVTRGVWRCALQHCKNGVLSCLRKSREVRLPLTFFFTRADT